MKSKTVISLLAAVLILAAASYFLLKDNTPETTADRLGAEFVKDLPINDIAAITIQSAADTVELKRGAFVWQVKNRFDYPADFNKISDFIKKIKKLKVGRAFEADDGVLARQKLNDPKDEKTQEDQKGIRVILADEKGKVLSDLIIGSSRQESPGGSGQYLRHSGQKTVYLVNETFSLLEQKPQEWLESEVISISGQEIKAVTSYAGNSSKAVYRLERKEPGKAPELNSPPKKGSVDSNKIDQVFEALSPLNIEDIGGPPRKADEPPPATPARLEYQLYDGRTITVYLDSKQGSSPENSRYEVVLSADYNAPETNEPSLPAKKEENLKTKSEGDARAGKGDETKTEESKDKKEAESKSPEEMKKEVSALNDKLVIWTYNIPKWQYDSFITSKQALMQTTEEATAK